MNTIYAISSRMPDPIQSPRNPYEVELWRKISDLNADQCRSKLRHPMNATERGFVEDRLIHLKRERERLCR